MDVGRPAQLTLLLAVAHVSGLTLSALDHSAARNGSASCSGCHGDKCTKECCPTARKVDPFCPNCKGADFNCLASRDQIGLGGWPAYGGTFNDVCWPHSIPRASGSLQTSWAAAN